MVDFKNRVSRFFVLIGGLVFLCAFAIGTTQAQRLSPDAVAMIAGFILAAVALGIPFLALAALMFYFMSRQVEKAEQRRARDDFRGYPAAMPPVILQLPAQAPQAPQLSGPAVSPPYFRRDFQILGEDQEEL